MFRRPIFQITPPFSPHRQKNTFFREILTLKEHFWILGQQVKPIISKGHSKAVFWIFHQIFFLAFNSRDITMLWVLNLFSRSSSTKLWKRMFEKMSQNFFLILKVGKWWDCLILTPFQRSNLGQKFRWKLFFRKKILCSLNECAHVLHHPETVENF